MSTHAAKRPRRDALSLDSLDVAALDADVAAAMRNASELRTVAAADAARESTFPFLADESSPQYAAHRAAYAYSSLLWAEATLGGGADAAAAALRACDLALLRGGVDAWGAAAAPIVERAEALHAERAPYAFASASAAAANDDAARHRHEAQCAHFSRPTLAGTTIPRVDARSLTAERFAAEYMEASPPQPVVLTHALDAWPALTTRPWRDTGYLRWACGARLVPVETCAADDATQTYLSGSFAQRVMSLGDFIAQYFEAEGDDAADSGGDDARGYLAQHQLFDQVPALRRDIAAPFVCAARTAEDREAPDECERRDEPLASAWFGPGGTVSPLHNDPYHNALCQVLGWKYVRLYDARETPRLYLAAPLLLPAGGRERRGRGETIALRRVRAADQLVARPAAREAGGRSLRAGCAARRQPRHPRAAGVRPAAAARRSCERRAASAAAPAPARPEARAARRRPRRAVAQRERWRRRRAAGGRGAEAGARRACSAIDAALVDAEQFQSLRVPPVRVENSV